MSDSWKNWCRICAKDEGFKISLRQEKDGLELCQKISKYLSIEINDDNLPNSVCLNCSSVLSDFNSFAVRCEKVQQFFETMVISDNRNECETQDVFKILRNDFLFPHTTEDHKFLQLDNTKQNESKEDEIEKKYISNRLSRKRKRTKDCNGDSGQIDELPIKYEVQSDGEMDRDLPDMPNESDSDEDYNIPLASVSDIKHKKTKEKVATKSGKKKKKKKVKKAKKYPKTEASLADKSVCIKAEPMSDAENLNDDLNIPNVDSKKVKKEKKFNPLAFLKYDCYICGYDAKNWNALCIHFRDVHDARAKIMCCCGKYLASRVSIGRHSAKHGKVTGFECPQCDKRFPRESELSTHVISHLPKEEYPFVCCKCARRFTTQQLLRHHEKMHVPMEERTVHTCEVCQSKFASKSSLMMHMKAIHERLKPFVCDQCGRAFTTKGILEEHQVRHSDARPHVCDVCHKSFKTKQRLAIHSDTHNDTVYQCPYCPIRLNSRRTLRMHLFVHDDVCRYKCNFCDKAFKRAKDLKNHSNLHTGRRPYSCPWCSRTFANGSNCRAHKRRMHPNELRVSDASAAMVNKVPAPQPAKSEDKQTKDGGTPKVIYTTVKRKMDAKPDAPSFVISPDADKDVALDKNNGDKKDTNETKPEKKSPIHNNYESSMSPLNLNTAGNKQTDPGDLAVNQNDNTLNDFQAVAESYNAILQSRAVEQTFGNGDGNEGIFNNKNTQLYTSFYNAAAAQFPTTLPFTMHFMREEDG